MNDTIHSYIGKRMTEVFHITFSLTRAQRILNPLERLLATLCGIVVLAAGLYGVVMAPMFLPNWVVFGVAAVLSCLVFGRQMASFAFSLLGDQYITTIVIEKDYIVVGVDTPELKLARNVLSVRKGLRQTSVIRHPLGYALVVPQEVISTTELKRLVERSLGSEPEQ